MAAKIEELTAEQYAQQAKLEESLARGLDNALNPGARGARERLRAAPVQVTTTKDEANASGFVTWPEGEPAKYNGSGWPCDMWIGPCSCGATHTADERQRQRQRQDNRPSIAELRRATPTDAPWQNGATLEILRAAPVLLEIAAAALAWAETQQGNDARACDLACQKLFGVVLAKVRP